MSLRAGAQPRWGGGELIAYLAIFALILWLVSRWLPANLLADEYVHWPQVQSFAQGKWEVNPWLSTWPTLNFIVALPVRITGVNELWFGRAVIALTACLAFIGYFKLLRALHTENGNALNVAGRVRVGLGGAGLRTLQFFCAPVILLFTSVVYTDIPALTALVWAAYAVVSRQRVLLLFAAAMTVAFRQSHIVWFAVLMLWHGYLSYVEQTLPNHANDGVARATGRNTFFNNVLQVVRGDRVLWLSATALALLWLVIVKSSGGVAYGVNTQVGHYVHVAGWGNLCFSMVVALLVFLPVMAGSLFTRRVVWNFNRVLVLMGVTALVVVGFQATLPGNIAAEAQVLLRNRLLAHLADPLGRAVMTFVCVTGLLAWIATDFSTSVKPLRWPLLFFSALYLLPFGLIEQRYYIPMFALFWAARKPQAPWLEWAQLAWCLTLSAMLIYQVAYKGKFL